MPKLAEVMDQAVSAASDGEGKYIAHHHSHRRTLRHQDTEDNGDYRDDTDHPCP